MEDQEKNLAASDMDDHHHAGTFTDDDEQERLNFEPTEDELVLHFLHPQLRGFLPRVPGAVLEADRGGLHGQPLASRRASRLACIRLT